MNLNLTQGLHHTPHRSPPVYQVQPEAVSIMNTIIEWRQIMINTATNMQEAITPEINDLPAIINTNSIIDLTPQ